MLEHEKVVAAVVRMVDAVNCGDFATALAAFNAEPIIVEDLAPFRWHGPNAASAWLAAMGANAARLQVQAVEMTLGHPARVVIDGATAYALFRGTLAMKMAQADLVAEGALTLTLSENGGSWLIDTLVWSGPEPAPA